MDAIYKEFEGRPVSALYAEIERLRALLKKAVECDWEGEDGAVVRYEIWTTLNEQLKVCPMCDLKLYDGKICRSCDYGCER